MYSFKSRVRYSEINTKKMLDLSGIVNYFQDCSTFQSEDIGKGVSYLEEANKVWVLNSWQIIVKRYPVLCEPITISTWAYDFKALYGYRNFMIQDESNQVCSIANSIWVLMDTKTKRPLKITQQDIEGYDQQEAYPMDYAPRKIALPDEWTTEPSFLVAKSSLDTNHHVNNGQYIKMAEEYLPEDFSIREMRAEYRSSALLHDTIVPTVSSKEDRYIISLNNLEEKPYAIIEFK